MPKERKKSINRKYVKTWEDEEAFKSWIAPFPGDIESAYCKYCKTQLRAHRSDLVQHAKTQKHVKNAEPVS